VNLIFKGEDGSFEERLVFAADRYRDTPEAMEIVDFIRADAKRPICAPPR
jgi:acyl-[acyl carrier protein]--UDP-N-acetylglucosamine O-acyltransferase